jgi:coronin-1B/1C/6
MSGRFVRQSKYRHIFGAIAKKDKAYQNIKPALCGEGNFMAASALYTAVPLAGGGGPVQIIKNGTFEKFGTTVARLNVHKAVVVDCAFAPYDHTLLATGDDIGQVSVTRLPAIADLPKDNTEYSALISKLEACAALPDCHNKKVAILAWNPNVKGILASIAFDNTLKIFDIEAQKTLQSVEIPDLPYYADWNTDGSRIAITRRDRSVSIMDPRDQKSEIKAEGLDAKPNRCVWADRAGKLIVTGTKGGSRVIAIYDPRKFTGPIGVVDVDQGGSVLTPYYDNDTSVLYLPSKGDATIRYYEVLEKDENDQYCFALSDFRDTESSKGGCFLPKAAVDVKSCEVAVFYRLMRDWVSPVSFTVPRKSDQFQADLFPDTYASPAYDSSSYSSIKEFKAPAKRSMKPGAEPVVAHVSSRTKDDVKRELEQAQARVTALTAELASLK